MIVIQCQMPGDGPSVPHPAHTNVRAAAKARVATDLQMHVPAGNLEAQGGASLGPAQREEPVRRVKTQRSNDAPAAEAKRNLQPGRGDIPLTSLSCRVSTEKPRMESLLTEANASGTTSFSASKPYRLADHFVRHQ